VHDFAESVEPAIATGACRHLAVLVNRAEDLPAVLASFYALGARRDGWLVHRAMPGAEEAERAELQAAGLDLGTLEREGRLVVHEIELAQPPPEYGVELERPFGEALDRGLRGMWYARFAVGDELVPLETVLDYDRHYEARFADWPTVTLCPFVVGELADGAAADGLAAIAAVHDGLAVMGDGGFSLLQPR
jgi:hypothetical protein